MLNNLAPNVGPNKALTHSFTGPILVGLAYYIAAQFSFLLSNPSEKIAMLWLPNAFVLTALLLNDRSHWWKYLVAMPVPHLLGAFNGFYSIETALVFYAANGTEVLVAAIALQPTFNKNTVLDDLRGVVRFLAWAVIIAPLFSATISSSIHFSGTESDYWLAWRIWYLGNLMGQLTLTPLLLFCFTMDIDKLKKISNLKLAETIFLISAVIFLSYSIFGAKLNSLVDLPVLLSFPVLALLLTIFRFGSRLLSAVIFIMTLIAIYNAINGQGPFPVQGTEKNIFLMYLFLITIYLPSILLGALMTERRSKKKQYQQSTSLFSAILESPNEIIIFALDKNYCYMSFNKSHIREMKKIYGADIALGENVLNYLRDDDERKDSVVRYDKVLNGERLKILKEYANSTGTLTYEWIYNPIHDDSSRVIGFSVYGTEITLRLRAEAEKIILERQVQHSQKLESLGVLAGGIAHDFNNLLAVIMGNANLMNMGLRDDSPLQDHIQKIEIACQRAAGLTGQMLAYSGKGKFTKEYIDLNELISETALLLNVSISKKAELKFYLADNIPVFEGDPEQIRQIVMNLITNASEAIGDQVGEIKITTSLVNCDATWIETNSDKLELGVIEPLRQGEYVCFEVVDTGSGMDEVTRKKIFEPFYTTKFTGRGLGMSAVLGIVNSHNGLLILKSRVDEGTKIKILLPALSSSALMIKNKIPSRDEWHGSGTILLVDDEEAVLSMGKLMLIKLGFDVLVAENGSKAIEVFERERGGVCCVILDLTMPMLDGEQVFFALKKLSPSIKVILCSGYNKQDATERFNDLRPEGFIHKPFTFSSLTREIRSVLEV